MGDIMGHDVVHPEAVIKQGHQNGGNGGDWTRYTIRIEHSKQWRCGGIKVGQDKQ